MNRLLVPALCFKQWCLQHPLILVTILYLSSTLISGPIDPGQASRTAHFRFGNSVIGRPIVLSGDTPHYLLIVSSLATDMDFDLGNNYAQAAAGSWDAGTRFRGIPLDHHVDYDRLNRQYSFHSPFMPIFVFFAAWPFRGTEWVESVCVWSTLLVTILGIAVFHRFRPAEPGWTLLLALATPIWGYARDFWTEPWLAVAWTVLLTCSSWPALAAAAFLGTLIKYSFGIVPLTMGLVYFVQRRYRRGAVISGSAVMALLTAILLAQYLFQEVDHFSFFHLGGRHAASSGSGQPGEFEGFPEGLVGLLLDPEAGLLWFCPFLIWGFRALARNHVRCWPALAFFLLHASYTGWRGGTGFSARYLVPAIPLLVLSVADEKPRGKLFRMAVIYSAFFGVLAGFLPAVVYDRTPWQAAGELLTKLLVHLKIH